jgi:hypothetical protein
MLRQTTSVLLSSSLSLLRASCNAMPLAGRSFSSLPMGETSGDNSGHLHKMNSLSISQQRGFAGSAPPAQTEEAPLAPGENSWTKFRAPYGLEQKSSLGAAMYLSIAVFGFSMYLNDLIYHPPRVVTMLGVMMLLMYVRRS